MNDRNGPGGPQLPDFSGGGRSGPGPQLPDFAGRSEGSATPSAPGPDGPRGGGRKGLWLAAGLGGAGCVTVLIIVLALVLSQTFFGPDPEEPSTGAGTPTTQEDPESDRPSEYVPTEEETDEAEGEITMAEQPTVECTILENSPSTEQVAGAVRGGGLEFTAVDGWDVGTDWSGSSAYQVDAHWAHQAVENGWYSTSSVAAVEWPQEEGGYPGAKETARAIFQCGVSREDVQAIYGSPAELVDYREESTTIDGHPAWVVSADVQLTDAAMFHTTDAWRLVVIVVDAPAGPAVFHGGAAVGHEQQVADLEVMVESLRVL